jgi:hypothetical protein
MRNPSFKGWKDGPLDVADSIKGLFLLCQADVKSRKKLQNPLASIPEMVYWMACARRRCSSSTAAGVARTLSPGGDARKLDIIFWP